MPIESPELLERQVQQALFLEALARSGWAYLRVTGTSMLPSLLPKDLLFLQRVDAAKMEAGDVVLFKCGSRLLVHRIVFVNGENLTTRGDALRCCDANIKRTEVLAKVCSIERFGRRFSPQPLGKLARMLGLLAGTQIIAALIVVAVRVRHGLQPKSPAFVDSHVEPKTAVLVPRSAE